LAKKQAKTVHQKTASSSTNQSKTSIIGKHHEKQQYSELVYQRLTSMFLA